MIDPKQLRVGNKVNFQFNPEQRAQEVTVAWISDDSIGYKEQHEASYPQSPKSFYGIPLTPEWLERMGFVKNTREEWDGPKIELEHSLEWFTIKGYGPDSFMLMGSEWTMGKPFQFVHQLQNLYFAVTGEELDIKL